MISAQYGREFTGAHYEKLKKAYSIWICMNPPSRRENTVTRYRLTEEHLVGRAVEPVRNYGLLSIVMLCLGGPDGGRYDGVLRLLDVLLSHETSEAEKRRILQDEYDIQMTQALESEASVMCDPSRGVMEKSWKKGVEKGVKENTLSSIRSLMETLGLTPEQARAEGAGGEAADLPGAAEREVINQNAGDRLTVSSVFLQWEPPASGLSHKF